MKFHYAGPAKEYDAPRDWCYVNADAIFAEFSKKIGTPGERAPPARDVAELTRKGMVISRVISSPRTKLTQNHQGERIWLNWMM